MLMWLRIRTWRQAPHNATVVGTYRFLRRTVQVLRTEDKRIEWVCDCDTFRRQSVHRQPLWCKHIARAAALRSLQRMTRRVALVLGLEA
jgi:hypothetical protein